jgi:acyl carrier protein
MNKTEFLRLLDELFDVAPGTVKETDVLDGIGGGFDSLAVISLLALVDEHFGCRLQPKQLTECKTVSDIMTLLDGHLT